MVIEILEADSADKPRTRYSTDAAVVERAEREYHEELKAKYEPK